jgi:hypothetical protein
MPVTGYRGPRAARRSVISEPAPPRTPEQRRIARRDHKTIVYDETFVLSTELRELAKPWAQRIADQPRPGRLSWSVSSYVESLHTAVSTIVSWIAEREGREKTRHLEPSERRFAVQSYVDLARRPPLPDITAEALIAGTWPRLISKMTKPVDEGLAHLLAISHPPGAFALRGKQSRSELLADLLREHVDIAGQRLDRAVDNAIRADKRGSYVRPNQPKSSDELRAELAAMGVEL